MRFAYVFLVSLFFVAPAHADWIHAVRTDVERMCTLSVSSRVPNASPRQIRMYCTCVTRKVEEHYPDNPPLFSDEYWSVASPYFSSCGKGRVALAMMPVYDQVVRICSDKIKQALPEYARTSAKKRGVFCRCIATHAAIRGSKETVKNISHEEANLIVRMCTKEGPP